MCYIWRVCTHTFSTMAFVSARKFLRDSASQRKAEMVATVGDDAFTSSRHFISAPRQQEASNTEPFASARQFLAATASRQSGTSKAASAGLAGPFGAARQFLADSAQRYGIHRPGTTTQRLCDAARARLTAAGYNLEDCELQVVHANVEEPTVQNDDEVTVGITQTYTTVDGRATRVIDYQPSLMLNEQYFDVDSTFEIRGGRILVSRWPQTEKVRPWRRFFAPESMFQRESQWLQAGQKLEFESNVPHSLFCDPVNSSPVCTCFNTLDVGAWASSTRVGLSRGVGIYTIQIMRRCT